MTSCLRLWPNSNDNIPFDHALTSKTPFTSIEFKFGQFFPCRKIQILTTGYDFYHTSPTVSATSTMKRPIATRPFKNTNTFCQQNAQEIRFARLNLDLAIDIFTENGRHDHESRNDENLPCIWTTRCAPRGNGTHIDKLLILSIRTFHEARPFCLNSVRISNAFDFLCRQILNGNWLIRITCCRNSSCRRRWIIRGISRCVNRRRSFLRRRGRR